MISADQAAQLQKSPPKRADQSGKSDVVTCHCQCESDSGEAVV